MTLCDPVDCSPAGSSVHGVLQTRILEWVPCPLPGDLPNPGIETAWLGSPALAGRFFTTNAISEASGLKAAAKSLQSCLTLCNPIDGSPPGSPVPGILQARILEWVPFPSPGDLPDPGIEPTSPALADEFFATSTKEALPLIYISIYPTGFVSP